MRRGAWTEERKDELRLLWPEPLSLDAIADQLSSSRDMVALWGARLGLPKRFSRYDGTWSEEDVADLRRMWAAGRSGSEIMRAIDFRHSRNGVIGKVHRLNLAGRAVKEREPRPSRARGPRPKKRRASVAYLAPHLRPKPRPVHVDLVPPEALMIPLLQLNDHTCKYALGEATGAAQLFCGAPKDIDSSWCPYHHHLVFLPSRGFMEKRFGALAEKAAA